MVAVARGVDVSLVDGVDELVEGVATCGLEAAVDDSEYVVVCRLPVDVDFSEHGDDILGVDGVLDLVAVDDKSLDHKLPLPLPLPKREGSDVYSNFSQSIKDWKGVLLIMFILSENHLLF